MKRRKKREEEKYIDDGECINLMYDNKNRKNINLNLCMNIIKLN